MLTEKIPDSHQSNPPAVIWPPPSCYTSDYKRKNKKVPKLAEFSVALNVY
jgi:hypothetical protein